MQVRNIGVNEMLNLTEKTQGDAKSESLRFFREENGCLRWLAVTNSALFAKIQFALTFFACD